MEPALKKKIFAIRDERTFRETALEVFSFQAARVPVYREYLQRLGTVPGRINSVEQIPFLPVEFFRTHRVIAEGYTPEITFISSGTTGDSSGTTATPSPARSSHHVASASLYRESFTRSFTHFYGDPEGLCLPALLPSYLERSGSSLIYMTEQLIGLTGNADSGFYLDDLEALASLLRKRTSDGQRTLLLGVSFALLDLARHFPMKLGPNVTVMETGGMKGRRREMIRSELHALLTDAFGVDQIHSEYGMTELLSQAYSGGNGIFRSPPWMSVLIRDPNDPFTLLERERPGGINIIDLANLFSCSFIATGDLGRKHPDGSFEVEGRFDQAEVRGCNLLVS